MGDDPRFDVEFAMPQVPRNRWRIGWVSSLIPALRVSIFLRIFGVIIVSFAAYAWWSIRSTSREWEQIARFYVQRFGDLTCEPRREADR
jgi:hypothetical protein